MLIYKNLYTAQKKSLFRIQEKYNEKLNENRSSKKYRGIIAVKMYNSMLLFRIQPEVETVFRKNPNGFRKNISTIGQILTFRWIIESVRQRIYRVLYFL